MGKKQLQIALANLSNVPSALSRLGRWAWSWRERLCRPRTIRTRNSGWEGCKRFR